MKTWEIKIIANDEMSAAKQLAALIEGFRIAAEHKLPLDSYFADTKEKYEQVTCTMTNEEKLITFNDGNVIRTEWAKPKSDAFHEITRGDLKGAYVHTFDIIKP